MKDIRTLLSTLLLCLLIPTSFAQQKDWNALVEESSRLRREQFEQQQREEDARERASARAAAAEESRIKAMCGDDYRTPNVGMTLSRLQQCVGKPILRGQLNRADGIVSTYTIGRTVLHVMEGKVISWNR
jgi:hypothetical protein